MRSNRWLAPVMLLSFFTLQGRIQAAEEIIELQLQHSKCLCGIVTYANGDPAQNARVEEFGPDWKEALRSTNTGSDGQSREDTFTIFKSRREHRGSTRCGSLFRLAAFGEPSCCASACTWRKSPALMRSRAARNVAIKTV